MRIGRMCTGFIENPVSRGCAMNRSGVIHQGVERAKLRNGLFEGPGTRLRICQIPGRVKGLAAGSGNCVAGCSGGWFSPVAPDIRACFRQCNRDHGAKAPARTGNKRILAV